MVLFLKKVYLHCNKKIILHDKQLTTQSAIHSITLNTALLEYLSSAGIRVLLTLYKQYGANNFAITRPSVFVRNILSQTGLEELIR